MQAQSQPIEPSPDAAWLPPAPPPKHVLSHASSPRIANGMAPKASDNARLRQLEDERKKLGDDRKQLADDLASANQEIANVKQQLAQVKGERDRIATQLSAEKEKARTASETGTRLEQRLHDEQAARKSAEKARDAVQQQLGGFLDSDSKFLERSLALQREQSRTVVAEKAHAESLAEEKRKREHAETEVAYAQQQLESERNKRRLTEATLREQEEKVKAIEEQARHAAAQQQVQPQVTTQQASLNAAGCTAMTSTETSVAASTQKLWRFIDAQSMMQGPYDSATMRSWMQQGYFQNHTLVRRDDEGGPQGPQWRPLANFGADPFK